MSNTIWSQSYYKDNKTGELVRTAGTAVHNETGNKVVLFAYIKDGNPKWLTEDEFKSNFTYSDLNT